MATVIRMPEVLAGSEEAAIQTWLVAVGQTLSVGMPLAEVETEKANVEYASEVEGTVLELIVAEGVNVKVGDPIAVVGAPDESAPVAEVLEAPDPVAEIPVVEQPVVELVETSAPVAESQVESGPTVASGSRQFVSPLVRRLARERGLDLSAVAGSGPGGRIVRRDIEGLASASAVASTPQSVAERRPEALEGALEAPLQNTDVPHTAMRRAIARRLTESKSTVPHFYLVADCRVDRLVALRKEVTRRRQSRSRSTTS